MSHSLKEELVVLRNILKYYILYEFGNKITLKYFKTITRAINLLKEINQTTPVKKKKTTYICCWSKI